MPVLSPDDEQVAEAVEYVTMDPPIDRIIHYCAWAGIDDRLLQHRIINAVRARSAMVDKLKAELYD